MKKFRTWFKGLTGTKQVLFILAVIIGLSAIGGAMSPNTAKTAVKKPAPITHSTITTKTVTENQAIPFSSTTVESSSLPKGQSKVTTAGVNGTKKLTYKVTYSNGKQTSKQLTQSEVAVAPVNQVTTVGTYVAPAPAPTPASSNNCNPNYSPCIPNVSYDLDCKDIGERVTVIGTDVYRLDADGDGIGCESY